MATERLNVDWTVKAFDALSVDDVYDVMALRQAVFVLEQRCCYADADGLDRSALHVLGRLPHGELVAYLRILPPGSRYADPSLGRVVVSRAVRGRGIGRSLMMRGIELATGKYPEFGIRLAAQTYLEAFYRNLGFVRAGEDYLEDGIPHVEMYRPAALSNDTQ